MHGNKVEIFPTFVEFLPQTQPQLPVFMQSVMQREATGEVMSQCLKDQAAVTSIGLRPEFQGYKYDISRFIL